MSYQSHPHCETPPDDAVIWRYTDFLKFSAMLANKGLWCSRADLLGDWREGRFTAEEERQLSTPELRNAFGNNRRLTFVNCWHESTIESMAMWDLYGRGVGSVALRSTVGNLKTALSSDDREFYLSRTKYLDWERGSSFPNNLFGMFVRKADAYKHEQEVRLLTWRPELQWETSATPSGGLVLNRVSDWLCERLIESNYVLSQVSSGWALKSKLREPQYSRNNFRHTSPQTSTIFFHTLINYFARPGGDRRISVSRFYSAKEMVGVEGNGGTQGQAGRGSESAAVF